MQHNITITFTDSIATSSNSIATVTNAIAAASTPIAIHEELSVNPAVPIATTAPMKGQMFPKGLVKTECFEPFSDL